MFQTFRSREKRVKFLIFLDGFADVLQSEKHVEIKDSETLVELKQAAMKEEVHGDFDLITLEPHFYIKIKSYMERLPEKRLC